MRLRARTAAAAPAWTDASSIRCTRRPVIFVPGEYIVYAFLNIPSIKRYQVVQRELEMLDITLVPDEGFGEPVLEQIRREIAKVVGASIAIRFHIADDIAPSPSGKFRVAICELDQQPVTST